MGATCLRHGVSGVIKLLHYVIYLSYYPLFIKTYFQFITTDKEKTSRGGGKVSVL